MSYDHKTGLVYINTLNYGFKAAQKKQAYHAGDFYFGADFLGPVDAPDTTGGFLKAIEPLTGKVRWSQPSFIPRYAGVLTTGGGLVITGALTGEVQIYDAVNGKPLWSFHAGSGVEGQPLTYELDGKQYIAVTSGNGGVLTCGGERSSPRQRAARRHAVGVRPLRLASAGDGRHEEVRKDVTSDCNRDWAAPVGRPAFLVAALVGEK